MTTLSNKFISRARKLGIKTNARTFFISGTFSRIFRVLRPKTMSDATSNPPGGFPTSLSSVSLSSESSSSMSSQVTGLRLRSEGNGGPSRCQPHQCSRSQPTRTPVGRPSSRTRRPRARKGSRRQPQLHRLDEFLVQSGKERNVVHSVWVLFTSSQSMDSGSVLSVLQLFGSGGVRRSQPEGYEDHEEK